MLLIIPQLFVGASLVLAAIEDARTRKVHILTWLPFAIGAIWILASDPLGILLVLPILGGSLLGVYLEFLGGADPIAFSGIALLGFSWSLFYAGMIFCFGVIAWSIYLLIRGKLIFATRVPAVPLACLSFVLALLMAYY